MNEEMKKILIKRKNELNAKKLLLNEKLIAIDELLEKKKSNEKRCF